tara:strand:+ start:362 stop:805 length:444 start_codon:yes stop_codon:yes gene_type:complete
MTNIEIDKIAHVGVPVSNTKKSLAFYQDALGLEFLSTRVISGDHISSGVEVPNAKIKVTLLKSNNLMVELLEYLNPKGQKFNRSNNDAGSMHIAFNVKDIDATYNNLKKLGFKCNQKPYPSSVPEGWAWFYARDPDGITVEFNGPIK